MSAPRAVPSVLAVSSDGEKAAVLDELVAVDHELKDRAEQLWAFRRPERVEVQRALLQRVAWVPPPAAVGASRVSEPEDQRQGRVEVVELARVEAAE